MHFINVIRFFANLSNIDANSVGQTQILEAATTNKQLTSTD